MVTLQKIRNNFVRAVEIVGLNTDTKPLNSTGGIEGQFIENGSTLFQMDDSRVFMFDQENDVWREI